ncbi:MAG: hypothetical protein PHF89_00380 [Eubacteriales bacterium]|jgi:hypothetical protein|nr:hypothetical protein [Eubacteriales bacterium]
MKRTKLAMIISISAFVIIYSAALVSLGIYLGKKQTTPPIAAVAATHFIVKEYNNQIAVFEEGSQIPIKYLSINIHSLRKQDRLKFQEGIVVENEIELAKLEEDFSN